MSDFWKDLWAGVKGDEKEEHEDEGEEEIEVEEVDDEDVEVEEGSAAEKALALLNDTQNDDEPLGELRELVAEELLEGLDYDGMFSSPEGMQSALSSVITKLVTQINELQKENVSFSRKAAQRTVNLRDMADSFYDKNEDLRDYKAIMRLFANEIMQGEPGIKPKALMEKAAEKTRGVLFGGEKGETRGERRPKPAFPSKAKSVKRGKKVEKRSKVQKEIDEMFGR